MSVVQVLVVASYPFLVYGGLTLIEPRTLALLIGAAVVLRGSLSRVRRCAAQALYLVLPVVLTALALILAAVLNDDRVLLLVPTLSNAGLLIAFGWTLWKGPSVVEIFARMHGPLPDEAVAYCRAVTGVWCLFFVFNGGIALGLALYASLAQWALYTGFVAYVLIGALFLTEAAYRRWRFPRFQGVTAVRSMSSPPGVG